MSKTYIIKQYDELVKRLYNARDHGIDKCEELLSECEDRKSPGFNKKMDEYQYNINEIDTAICVLNIGDALGVSVIEAANMLYGHLVGLSIRSREGEPYGTWQFRVTRRMDIIRDVNDIAELIGGARNRIGWMAEKINDERREKERERERQKRELREKEEKERIANERAKRVEAAKRHKLLGPDAIKLMEEYGIYETQAYALAQAGYKTPEDIENASLEELRAIKNVGQGTLRALKGEEL